MATMTTNTPPTTTPTTSRPRTADRTAGVVAPAVDIYETDKAFVLLADMPGVAPDGLDVVAERNELVIRGRVDPPASTPDYQEFELASYYRTFTLTDDLDTAGISATLRDGVLRIEIPKSPKVQPKKIPVRTE
jgi:HSP20 family protein